MPITTAEQPQSPGPFLEHDDLAQLLPKPQNLRRDDRSRLLPLPESRKTRVDKSSGYESSINSIGSPVQASTNRTECAPRLSIEHLHAAYLTDRGEVQAVDDVGFEVRSGEFFTLLGPSGCGKTTTLRSVAGFERPKSGSIMIDGEVVFSSRTGRFVPVHRRDIAMVFQSYAIWPHMSVAENVAFPLDAKRVPSRESRSRVERALAMVNLTDHYDRPATQLSGGQQQRVALARAIVKEAKLLLLDEPLSNLDAQLRVQMRSELSMLQSRLGTTTLYVTHDQDEALSLSDRVAVMCEGRIVEIGTPASLYRTPKRLFTARFIGQAELLPATVVSHESGNVIVETPIGQVRVAHDGVPASAELTLMIRPEHMELAESTSIRDNVVPGRIEQVVFTGRVVEYLVRVGSSLVVKVQCLSATIHAKGENVRLHFPPACCELIDETL